jgi:hypothetical protein
MQLFCDLARQLCKPPSKRDSVKTRSEFNQSSNCETPKTLPESTLIYRILSGDYLILPSLFVAIVRPMICSLLARKRNGATASHPRRRRQMFQLHRSSLSLRSGAAIVAALQVFAGIPMPAFSQNSASEKTRSPIKHVIVIIGENRSFDHVFATYKPLHGQSVDNLLSKRVIMADGKPGANYALAEQYRAEDFSSDEYQMSPPAKTVYETLPPPLAGGPTTPFVTSLAEAKAVETGLPDDQYYTYLTTGETGLKGGTPDARIPNVTDLPPGPFQITPGIPSDGYAASPVHRFYQLWPQLD